ncbi:MAG TPA: hypothetical protein PLB63_10655, partial [Planctomycetota bacterium]|nr:hypothetical protein [Planctomycetota bacterium]
NNINPYLVDAPNIIVKNRSTPLCNIPKMTLGNAPVDGGNLIIKENEVEEFIKKEPKAKKFIKKLIGAQELLYNKDRYVLWLVDATPQEIQSMPLVQERIEKVRNFRLKSPKKATREKALTPYLFTEIRQLKTNYLAVPIVTSERRAYIPIGFLPHTTIANHSLFCIPDCPLYIFAILSSKVHNAWMRVVAGRFGIVYRYSASVVYNNFPFPELTETQKQKLNELGQNILDVRAKYPDSSLATLYDPLTMPPALLKAHQKLDKEVAKIYNKNWDLDNEAEIVSDLMQMYQQLLTTETSDNKNTETMEIEDDETTEHTEHTEHTETENTDNMENIDKKESTKTKTRKSKKQTTKYTEIDNKDIDNKESKKTITRKTKKTDNNETKDKETKDNSNTKVKTRKTKKTDNNETENKELENKQTKVKTRKTKKTDNNETETEIYASIPMTSKRTIKKITISKVAVKKTTNKKVAKPKVTTKSTKEIKTTNKK